MILRSTKAIANYLGCSTQLVLRLIEEGLPAGKVGRDWTTSTDLLDQWLITKHIEDVHKKVQMRSLKLAKRAAEQRLQSANANAND